MSSDTGIRYLTQREIDKDKWDRCIDRAGNGLLYAYSYYLDHMARNWDAIVLDDYRAVMPLPWHSKFGIRYIYQPFLTAQLGVFGQTIPAAETTAMIQAIPASFRLIEISLNSSNHPILPKKDCITRSNYILPLAPSYQTLEKGYNENTKRNIKKALQAGCVIKKGIDIEEVIQMAVAQMDRYDKQSGDNVERFRKLFHYLDARDMTATYAVCLGEQIASSAVFFITAGRAYYILVGNHPDGRHLGASHALIDGFIKDHAGKDMVLDFEGSDIRSLAAFYSGFGAQHETYPALKINRLPVFLRWMKK